MKSIEIKDLVTGLMVLIGLSIAFGQFGKLQNYARREGNKIPRELEKPPSLLSPQLQNADPGLPREPIMNSSKLILKHIIDSYIDDKLGTGRLCIRRATWVRLRLVGDNSHCWPLGFVQFLESAGVKNPSMEFFTSHWVGKYWEFLAQQNGLMYAYQAMRALRPFWVYCKKNNYLPKKAVRPPDLNGTEAIHRFQVRVSIANIS